jgi:hypothetical protein
MTPIPIPQREREPSMEKTSLLQRIIDLFFTPSRAFVGYADGITYKDWLYPLIIVSAVLIVLPYFFLDISLDEAERQMEKSKRMVLDNPDFPEDRLEQARENFAKYEGKIEDARNHPFAFRNIWMKILIPIMYCVMAAFFAGILLLIGNFGMGGSVKFSAMFTMVMLTYLIGGNGFFMNMLPGVGSLELLVKTPMIVMRGSTDVILSPGLFFDQIDSFTKQFFNQLDVFRVWGMVVMGFGFAKLYKKSTGSGIAAVVFPWMILVAVAAALIQANNRMMG